MLRQWKGFLSGFVFTLSTVALTATVFAAVTSTSLSVYYDNIKIILNGKEIEAKDANGAVVEPFIYNGTTYVPIRAIAEAYDKLVEWDANSKHVIIYNNEIEKLWDTLVPVPDEYTGLSIYWKYIEDEIMVKVDSFIEKYGADVLFQGLRSANVYSQYYCINKLVEYYNDEDIRTRAITEITPFLNSTNDSIKHGAEFAISILSKEFNSPYIAHGANGVKVFTLFNNYSDFGSYHKLWIIENDKLSKLYSFTESYHYIYITEPIQFSPDQNKIAVQTCTRKGSSFQIIDLNNRTISPEIMVLVVYKVAADNKHYNNTYPNGQYCWCSNINWIDDHTVSFEASLAFDYMEIIENVIVTYNVLDNTLEYIRQ